jgi:hypothetical protein
VAAQLQNVVRFARRYWIAILLCIIVGQLTTKMSGGNLLYTGVWCMNGSHILAQLVPHWQLFPQTNVGQAANMGICIASAHAKSWMNELSSLSQWNVARNIVTHPTVVLELFNEPSLKLTSIAGRQDKASYTMGDTMDIEWSLTGFSVATSKVQIRLKPRSGGDPKNKALYVAENVPGSRRKASITIPCTDDDPDEWVVDLISHSKNSEGKYNVYTPALKLRLKVDPGSTCAYTRLIPECQLPVSDRLDAGYPGVNRRSCLEKAGACWDTTYTNAPNCFMGKGSSTPQPTAETSPIKGNSRKHIQVPLPNTGTVIAPGEQLLVEWIPRGDIKNVQVRLAQVGREVVHYKCAELLHG